MVVPTFMIDLDPERSFLHITLAGDWNEVIAGLFAADLRDHFRRIVALNIPGDRIRALVDMSGKNILPKDIATDMARLIPAYTTARIAIVVSGTIHLMQARRLCAAENRRCFTTMDEARQWLFAAQAG